MTERGGGARVVCRQAARMVRGADAGSRMQGGLRRSMLRAARGDGTLFSVGPFFP
jgi:hypothetical protein